MRTGDLRVETTAGDQRGNAVEATYLALRERIISGLYRPGSGLSQVQLARELEVSRTPLREALQRLEAEGLVVSAVNRGVVVAPVELADIEDSYAMRLLVEPAIISAVLETVTAADVAAMHDALVTMSSPSVSSRDFQLAHWDFHRVILARCPSGIQAMIESHLTRIDRHQRLYFSRPVALADVTTTDALFLGAVEARDPELVRSILEFHLIDTALGLIVAGDPQHVFCSLTTTLIGQSISLSGLDDIRVGQQAEVSWTRGDPQPVLNLRTASLRVAGDPATTTATRETSAATAVLTPTS